MYIQVLCTRVVHVFGQLRFKTRLLTSASHSNIFSMVTVVINHFIVGTLHEVMLCSSTPHIVQHYPTSPLTKVSPVEMPYRDMSLNNAHLSWKNSTRKIAKVLEKPHHHRAFQHEVINLQYTMHMKTHVQYLFHNVCTIYCNTC